MLSVPPQTQALTCAHLFELWGLREEANNTHKMLSYQVTREGLVPDA